MKVSWLTGLPSGPSTLTPKGFYSKAQRREAHAGTQPAKHNEPQSGFNNRRVEPRLGFVMRGQFKPSVRFATLGFGVQRRWRKEAPFVSQRMIAKLPVQECPSYCALNLCGTP